MKGVSTMTNMIKVNREILYRACKFQSEAYYADHGMNLAKMWEVVNSGTRRGDYWKEVCLAEYAEYIERGIIW